MKLETEITKEKTTFHKDLHGKMDELVHYVYSLTKKFPKEELYGIVSQLRRSALSIVLNYIEGYARFRDKTHKHFLQISYGSLKETDYLLEFSMREKYITTPEFDKSKKLTSDIGAMLWGMLRKL